jgi:hypothetical protein
METSVVKLGGVHKVRFAQGVQTFTLDHEGNKKSCEWYKGQLDTAFENFKKELAKNTPCVHPFDKVISCGNTHNCTLCGQNI